MGTYADVKNISDDLQKPEVDKSSLDDCLDNAGWELQAINWAFEKITGESLVEKIITPITGDWSKIHADGDAWRNVGNAMSTISYNLTHNVGELREHWDGEAAKTHEAYIVLVWKSGLFAEKEVANLIGKGFDKIADGSEKLGEQAAKLLEYIIKKVEDAIEKAWIPLYGWAKAAEYVWDAYQVYCKVVDLIETLKQLIEDVKALFGGISKIASALGKIKDVNSLADAAEVASEVTDGVGDIQQASGDIKDDVKDATDDLKDINDTVGKHSSSDPGTTTASSATTPASTSDVPTVDPAATSDTPDSSSTTPAAVTGPGNGNNQQPPGNNEPPQTPGDGRPIHSRYPDGTPVYEGEQPKKVKGPDPAADGAPHTVLKWDEQNGRVYKAREYGTDGTPVRDIDFTHPTFPNGRPRPDHVAPEEHPYIPNDPDNPKAGYKRGPGRPLSYPE